MFAPGSVTSIKVVTIAGLLAGKSPELVHMTRDCQQLHMTRDCQQMHVPGDSPDKATHVWAGVQRWWHMSWYTRQETASKCTWQGIVSNCICRDTLLIKTSMFDLESHAGDLNPLLPKVSVSKYHNLLSLQALNIPEWNESPTWDLEKNSTLKAQ